jgi:hypothetical protein
VHATLGDGDGFGEHLIVVIRAVPGVLRVLARRFVYLLSTVSTVPPRLSDTARGHAARVTPIASAGMFKTQAKYVGVAADAMRSSPAIRA